MVKSNILKTISLVVVVTLLIAANWDIDAEAAAAVGKITRVKGSVLVNRGPKPITAKVGTRVMPGDVVQTNADAGVKMLMNDSTVLSLGPNSKMRIRSYRSEGRARRVSANYDLVYGRGRANVPKGKSKNIRFTTPSAVAGVRGTQVIFEYNPATGETRIIAVGGTVTVINPDNPSELIILTAGMGTTVGTGGIPSSPFEVSPQEIAQLLNSTDVPESSPRRVIIINLPGTSPDDVNNTVDGEVEIEGTENGLDDDSGVVGSPEDLINQEPPPFTEIILNLTLINQNPL